MANLKKLKKLLKTLGLSLKLKDKWLEVLECGGFISPQNGNLRCKKLLRSFRRCYILLCYDFFEQRETNIK